MNTDSTWMTATNELPEDFDPADDFSPTERENLDLGEEITVTRGVLHQLFADAYFSGGLAALESLGMPESVAAPFVSSIVDVSRNIAQSVEMTNLAIDDRLANDRESVSRDYTGRVTVYPDGGGDSDA